VEVALPVPPGGEVGGTERAATAATEGLGSVPVALSAQPLTEMASSANVAVSRAMTSSWHFASTEDCTSTVGPRLGRKEAAMTRYGGQFGPDLTFLGVDRCDLDEPETYQDADVVIIGAPFDGGTSYRSGARMGPQAIRMTDYNPHDGSRPSLALRADGLRDLRVVDAGDVEMFSGDAATACQALEKVVTDVAAAGPIPVILGGDHTVTWPNVTGVARHVGWGRVSVLHFDAHADTGDLEFGSLIGHGQPMRRLIESGAARGDRFLQIGLRGYWPGPATLDWMAEQGMRSYEMTEITHRGLATCLDEACAIAVDDCDGVFLSVDIDVADPAHAPGTGTPEPGGISARQLLDSVRHIAYHLPVVGMDVVEVSPAYDHADITAALANRVVLEALSAIARRRAVAAGGPAWDPHQPLLDGR
jgi:agmatinase